MEDLPLFCFLNCMIFKVHQMMILTIIILELLIKKKMFNSHDALGCLDIGDTRFVGVQGFGLSTTSTWLLPTLGKITLANHLEDHSSNMGFICGCEGHGIDCKLNLFHTCGSVCSLRSFTIGAPSLETHNDPCKIVCSTMAEGCLTCSISMVTTIGATRLSHG